MNTKSIKTAAAILLLTAISGFNLYADGPKPSMPMKEGVCMMDDKMMHMDDKGKCMMMQKTMTMPDGTKVMKNGECMMKGGEKKMMKNGEMMTMDSKVTVMDDATKTSVMEQSKQK